MSNALVAQIPALLAQYQAGTMTAESLQVLRAGRLELARRIQDLESAQLGPLFQSPAKTVYQKICDSDIRLESLQPEEAAFVDEVSQRLQRGGDAGESLPTFLAGLLYKSPHQLPGEVDFGVVPMECIDTLIALLLKFPSFFSERGEVDAFAGYTNRLIAFLHQNICAFPDSPRWQQIATQTMRHVSQVQLYFSDSDCKEIATRRADIIELVMRASGFQLDYVPPPRPQRERIRIGVLSAQFTPQAETYVTLPIFEHLDRSRHEIRLYALLKANNPFEHYCRSRADSLTILPQDVHQQARLLRSEDLDLLMFGSNVTAVTSAVTYLAAHRLARAQAVASCCPITTGMRHTDYYISGSYTEPENAESRFREKLLLTDGPAHAFRFGDESLRPSVAFSREQVGVPADATVFVSGANLFKLIPELRHAWARVLAGVPDSHLILYPFNPNWMRDYPVRQFTRRVQTEFSRLGIESHRVILLTTRLPLRRDVHELLKLGDIYLDSFRHSGATSLIDPLTLGMPVVVAQGPQGRSRQSAAMLRALDAGELVTDSDEQYIELAVKLGRDPQYRQQVRAQIQAGMSRTPKFLDSHWYARETEKLIGQIMAAMPSCS